MTARTPTSITVIIGSAERPTDMPVVAPTQQTLLEISPTAAPPTAPPTEVLEAPPTAPPLTAPPTAPPTEVLEAPPTAPPLTAPPMEAPPTPTATEAPPTAPPTLVPLAEAFAPPTENTPAASGATAAPATPTPADIIVPPTLEALTGEERWRKQQIDRQVFDSLRLYSTTGSELWWYDPVQQQHVILGSFSGNFTAQAQFTLLGQGVKALEVPYQVNQSYGLTALSPALLQRIEAAGYHEWIETYVFDGPHVQPR